MPVTEDSFPPAAPPDAWSRAEPTVVPPTDPWGQPPVTGPLASIPDPWGRVPSAPPPPPSPPDPWGQNASVAAATATLQEPQSDPGKVAGWVDSASGTPEPGELGIKERRSWHTWQLLVAVGLAAVFGMFIGNLGNSSSAKGSAGSSSSGYALPPPSSSGSSTGASTTTTPSTTTPPSATSTTAPATATAGGTAQVLVPRYQSQGNWTSPTFTITSGTWQLGWAFQCSPAPSSGSGFQAFAITPGGSPGTAAVTGSGASGSGITPLTSAGAQQIQVQAAAGCIWVVKVTGIGST